MPTLTALCVVHNGEALLEECLASVAFCDEIVVVLDRCTDRSKAIAQAHKAVLVEGGWEIEGPRRNAGLDACTKDYVLEIDADERVPTALAQEIQGILQTNPNGGVYIPFDNRIGGRTVTHGWGAYNGVIGKLCLFKRGTKRWGPGRLHPRNQEPPEVARTQSQMIHLVYNDLPHMYQRLLRYSRLAAEDMVETGKIPGGFSTARRVVSRFLKAYVQRGGHKEGVYGVALAVYSGLYPLLSYLMAQELKQRALK